MKNKLIAIILSALCLAGCNQKNTQDEIVQQESEMIINNSQENSNETPIKLSIGYGIADRYNSFEHYKQDTSPLSQVLITTNIAVKNVSLIQGSIDENFNFIAGDIIYTASEITPEHPLFLEVQFIGTLSPFGIRYLNHNGDTVTLMIQESGKDGSLTLVSPSNKK